jgi:hypothetical protein
MSVTFKVDTLPFGTYAYGTTMIKTNLFCSITVQWKVSKTRLKILPVLTREHYTSLLHWV